MRFKTGGSKCSALVALGLIPTTCWSAIIWDEATQGDLSGDRFAPTSLTLTLGDNSLSATSQGGDLEYVTITVSEGELLSGLVLRSYSGSDGRAFIGIQAGTTFTEPPTTQSAANLLG